MEAEYAVAPVPVTKPSWDLLRGPGRIINRMKKLKTHPTVEFIAKAREKHPDAYIEVEGVWVMQAWKSRLSEWRVNPTDAANRMLMKQASTHAELKDIWRRPDVGIIVVDDDGGENIDVNRYCFSRINVPCRSCRFPLCSHTPSPT